MLTRLIAIDCITNMSFSLTVLNWVFRDQLFLQANQVKLMKHQKKRLMCQKLF